MPKEMIHSRTPGQAGYQVEVGWQRDFSMQVGVVNDDGRSLFWTLTECASYEMSKEEQARRLAELGSMIQAALAAPMDEPGEGMPPQFAGMSRIGALVLDTLDAFAGSHRGVFADLDRAQANALVRLLRKARDAAYGRDE